MYNATAYNHVYGDTGLFCIHSSAPPQYVGEMVQVIVQEMLNMAGDICPEELRVSIFLHSFYSKNIKLILYSFMS